jgi:hypothetical protein
MSLFIAPPYGIHPDREERKKAVELLCKKPSKFPQNREDLLHNRDMEKAQKKHDAVIPLFSVN